MPITLPPGTLHYLKGHYDGIVMVVLAAMAFASLTLGAPAIPTIVVLGVAAIGYHWRCGSKQDHDLGMARLKLEEAVAKAELVKARHRDLLANVQPALPLERHPRTLSNRSPDDGRTTP